MQITPDNLRETFLGYFDEIQSRVSTANGDWTVKGFIDLYQRIYTISLDTKVLSKVLELLMFPVITKFAQEHNYRVELAQAQNHYPDITLVSPANEYYAIDIKSTFRKGRDRKSGEVVVNGMTLGTFGGYFRARTRAANSTYPYNLYTKHYVLGVVYTQVKGLDERVVYNIADLAQIPSVAKDFQFFFQEKYRIASDRAGSGNTTNIGATRHLSRLIDGSGVFAQYGVEVFDGYWTNYRTRAMARNEGFDKPPYTNLREYQNFITQSGAALINVPQEQIPTEAFEDDQEIEEFDQEN